MLATTRLCALAVLPVAQPPAPGLASAEGFIFDSPGIGTTAAGQRDRAGDEVMAGFRVTSTPASISTGRAAAAIPGASPW